MEVMKIKDRIKELRRVKASEILPNPKNWRTHGKDQSDALKGVLAEIGFANAVLARETKEGLMLVDGHLRTETAGDTLIPVLVLDVNEDEADKLLLTLDPLASMAGTNAKALEELLDNVRTDNFAVSSMLAQLREQTVNFNEIDNLTNKDGTETILKSKDDYESATIRQMVLTFNNDQYEMVSEAFAEYCEKNGLSSNTEAVVNLLHEQGYHVNPRQTEAD
jgi:hypothetical protein